MKLLPTNYYLLPTKRRRRSGFSFIELLVVMGITAVIAGVALISLLGRRSTVELNTTSQKIAALLREAQSRSMVQASSSAWGVRFDNVTSTAPFYSLFGGAYSAASRENYYSMPSNLRFATSSIAAGTYAATTFEQVSGNTLGSTSIRIYMVNDPNSSTTITIDPSGAVSY